MNRPDQGEAAQAGSSRALHGPNETGCRDGLIAVALAHRATHLGTRCAARLLSASTSPTGAAIRALGAMEREIEAMARLIASLNAQTTDEPCGAAPIDLMCPAFAGAIARMAKAAQATGPLPRA